MRDDITSPIATALASRRLNIRKFFQITVYNGGSPLSAYFWSGLGDLPAVTLDGLTRTTSTITYRGSGSLISCSDIVLTNDLSVRSITVTLSQVNDTIDTYIRGYNLRNAKVQVGVALFDPDTQILKDYVYPRFVGIVDGCQINTPQKNDTGSVVLSCVSCTRDLTTGGIEKRSHESQQIRHSGDTFFKYVSVMGGIQVSWALAKASVGKNTSSSTDVAAQQAAVQKVRRLSL